MEKKLLPYLVVISALSISISAAVCSVSGIGKMFAGSSMSVMIMMSFLEIAKLVIASLLYQYWDRINKLLKVYYFIAVLILMIITSAGIYSYLSSAYSETSNKLENVDKQIGVLNAKRDMFANQLSDIRKDKENLSNNINSLTEGLSNNKQSYKDRDGNIITTTSSSNRKSFESQLASSQTRLDNISLKELSISDSISSIDMKKLELETNSELATEIGPLKYIAKITNTTIDYVVNWFIFALMLVFDPLAISLVIGANVIFRDQNLFKSKLDQSKKIDEKIELFKLQETEFELKKVEFLGRESELLSKEKELSDKLNEYDINIKNLQAEESNLRDKVLAEEDRLKSIESSLGVEYELIKTDRKDISSIKKDLNKQSRTIKEDREELDIELSKLEDIKEELSNKESAIELAKDDLIRLDNEIKDWESRHWKLKRTPPASAIFD